MANEAHKIKLLVLWDILCKNTDENHALKTKKYYKELGGFAYLLENVDIVRARKRSTVRLLEFGRREEY